MTQRIITQDFVRELSVWQQEIEVEANHFILPQVLGIKCFVFFFANSRGIATAYRLKRERDALPQNYLRLASQAKFSEGLYDAHRAEIQGIKAIARRSQSRQSKISPSTLLSLRKKLLSLWPAYLYGYNISRYFEKGIFKPESIAQKEALVWAHRMHHYFEGVYDLVESFLGEAFAPLLQKAKMRKEIWRSLRTFDLLRALEFQTIDFKDKNDYIVDADGIYPLTLRKYIGLKGYKIASAKKTGTKTLRGTVAYAGKVTGRVRILTKNDLAQMKHFQKGEILVAMVVAPCFLPALRKAGAIITDYGGLASHAAIVARELQKPCIVGTRQATQILKNQDLVKVDARKGVITKLSVS